MMMGPGYSSNNLGWGLPNLPPLHNDWMNVTLNPTLAMPMRAVQGMSYMLRNLETDCQYEARIEAK